ncbi:syntaxin-18 isoform X1 [Lingula anatina]|uniref:Syntaxin-18 n=2 Tax=Lingula anatina TaxID=7574 RepID=A0A1S3I403_LINAN|nr:syntaxin-18 isoform X1 [Lingula anatina]|eukprot:XP_013392995.1 syntaxin-18 isoform X1 [Lingula anatina]
MEITSLFRATVKTVRMRQKSQGLLAENDKTNILPKAKPKTCFESKAKDVVSSITKLRDFLLEHRKDYINASSHLNTNHQRMSDFERDEIDESSQAFMKACSETIKFFKADVGKEKTTQQVKEHREAILELLENYLKVVCKIYSEQKAVRVKRVFDKKKIGRLEPQRRRKMKDEEDSTHNLTTKSNGEPVQGPPVKKSHTTKLPLFGDEDGDEEISQEEMQLFEQENKHMYEEMNNMVDEIRQIEGKVVEISRLQEIFTEKVLEQEKDIDRIGDTVVGTTENVIEANEEIREAIKNNAGFRVWILFFLVVLSFSLLFLDWYNA